jgi:hypoxanthine phosphoribosyltransferase
MFAVPKSARAAPGERPPISLQYESLRAHSMVDVSDRILVVDDVVTKGATAVAAVSRLEEVYPEAQIALFATIRTRGLVPEIEHILDPVVGTIRLADDEPNREP